MRFVVDAQLPPVFAARLRTDGFDARHVRDVGLLYAPDTTICAFATSEGAIVISKDRDYLDLARLPDAAFRLVWLGCGNCSNRQLLAFWDTRWPGIQAMLNSGTRVIEAI